MEIKPINGHILIEPLKHDSFFSTDKATYEEIGTVLEMPEMDRRIAKGTKVYFDSWLAAKYPTGKDNDFFWLVKYKDVRAIEENVQN